MKCSIDDIVCFEIDDGYHQPSQKYAIFIRFDSHRSFPCGLKMIGGLRTDPLFFSMVMVMYVKENEIF